MASHHRTVSSQLLNEWSYDLATLPDSDHVRIVKLLASVEPDSAVYCELLVEPLGDSSTTTQRYEALSWTWGRSDPKRDISIMHNNRSYYFKVTRHLEQALKALRHHDEPRYLWIDAICINQTDLEEKNQQVPRMDLIYGTAQNVCIWLGEEEAESHEAMEFIREKVLKLWDFDKLCEDSNNRKMWQAMVALMKRPWFSRRWIVQEIALAQQATVHCGRSYISWAQFANAVSLFVEVETAPRRLSQVIRDDKSTGYSWDFFSNIPTLGAARLVETTDLLFRTSPSGERIRLASLETLVSRLPIFASSEPRDTIYALLALASDSNPRKKDVPD